jgi:hypothetical protein
MKVRNYVKYPNRQGLPRQPENILDLNFLIKSHDSYVVSKVVPLTKMMIFYGKGVNIPVG